MTLRTRRILYISFILAFLAITPLVIIYAMGFSIDTSGRSIVKTGTLYIDTVPEGADIYLNSKLVEDPVRMLFSNTPVPVRTPVKLGRLLPGEYTLKLARNGYWDLSRKIKLHEGESVSLEKIVLFMNSLPLKSAPADYPQIFPEPDGGSVLYGDAGGASIYDVSSETLTPLAPVGTLEGSSWSAGGRYVLAGKEIICDTDEFATSTIMEMIGSNAALLKWDKNDEGKLYYLQGGRLNEYEISSGVQTILPLENVIDFSVFEGNVAALTRKQDGIYITLFSPERPDNWSYALQISGESTVDFEGRYAFIEDQTNRTLFIIEPDAPLPMRRIIRGANIYSRNENVIYTAGESEIWMHWIDSSKSRLLTRISGRINSVLSHPLGNHVIFTTDKEILIAETQAVDDANITQLIEFDEIASPFLSKEGDVLYFFGAIGRQKGIYKLKIL